MGYLFDSPTLHKLADIRILSRRRAAQLGVIHVRQRFDIAHIKQDRDESRVERIIFYLMPRDRADKLRRQRARLALVPL